VTVHKFAKRQYPLRPLRPLLARADRRRYPADRLPTPGPLTGYESRPYDDVEEEEPWVRACTPDEVALLDASEAAGRAAERAEDEQLGDEWFAMLRDEVCWRAPMSSDDA